MPDHILNTLQYCLETFEQTCQCGKCDPCKNGQNDIVRAIEQYQDVIASLKWIVAFCNEHPEWFGAEDGAEGEWLETATRIIDRVEARNVEIKEVL